MIARERSGRVPPVRGAPEPSARERMIRLRLMIVGLTVSLWALGATVRLFQLQVLGRASFERQAARQSERTLTVDPRRGPILDRNGHALAVSVDAESIYAVPQDVSDAKETAAALARALGLDAAARKDLFFQLQRNRAFVWVKRKVDPGTAHAVREMQLDGVGFLSENRRYYPQRELASQVLGYVGLDNTGMSGIEYAFESQIRGRGAKVVVRTDARRHPVGVTEKPSTEGSTVLLTLDEAVQHVAERELERAVVETGSQAGVAVVLDPRTGEILAMANRPTFNPNRFGSYGSAHWKNRAVADAYEPGSLFKIITAAAGLQEKIVSPDEVLDCGGGYLEIAGVRINDHAVFFQLPFRDVIAKSSDVGAARVAQRLGREQFYRYVHDFGFGSPTGIELPGESAGLLRPTSRWSALSLATLAFGQEIGVTALQMALAVGAVANGGTLMKPMIVREVDDAGGRVVQAWKPTPVRKVLEADTVATLTDILKGVVTGGTGKRAAIPGYVVAGKTGTAQKVDASGHYSHDEHVISFAGFVPASRPELVVLVSLDDPRGSKTEGGVGAAPVFARIAEQALRLRAVPPDDLDHVLRAGLAPTSDLVPAAYHPDAPASPSDAGPGLMPDLRGASAREAAIAAARRGLVVGLKGTGRVVAQVPEPGAPVEVGRECLLVLDRTPPAAPLVEGQPVAPAPPPRVVPRASNGTHPRSAGKTALPAPGSAPTSPAAVPPPVVEPQ